MALEQDILQIGFDYKKAQADADKVIAQMDRIVQAGEKFTASFSGLDVSGGFAASKKSSQELKSTIDELMQSSKIYTQQLKEEARQQAAIAQTTTATEKINREKLKTDQEISKTQTAKEKATAALLKTNQEQLKADNADIKIQREKIKAELDSEKLTQQQLRTASLRAAESNKAIALSKKEQKAIDDLSNDYKQLSLAYNEAALRAKNLGLQQGFNTKAAKEAAAYANNLGDILKKADAVTGTFNRNVGNYPKLESAASALNTLFGTAAVALGINSIGDFFSSTIDEANQAEQATTRFRNALQNIGREDVFNRLTKKADDFVNTFRYLDNDDVTEVFQQLITYGKLTEKQITDLTPVIINFAAKSGLSLNESASTIIKALEGNAKALKEYGISIKDGKDVTERFGIVMTELKGKVEGAADAFQKTFSGSVAVAKQDIANLKEEIGNQLTPILGKFYQSVYVAITGIKSIASTVKDAFENAFGAIALGAGILKDFATFDFSNISKRIEKVKQEREAVENSIKSQKELSEARKVADNVAADAATKPLQVQQEILKANIALKEASFKNYNDLVGQGKKLTTEGHAAALQLYTDSQVVLALQKGIAQAQDKTILGTGDPNKIEQKGKHIRTIADALKDLDNEFKALQSEQNKGIITFPEADLKRAEKVKSTIEEIFKLKDSDANKENAAIKLSVILNPISLRILEREIKDFNKKTAKDQFALPVPDVSKVSDALKEITDDQFAATEKGLANLLTFQQTQQLKELNALEEKHNKGKISEKDYQKGILEIQSKYSKEALKIQIDYLNAEIALLPVGSDKRIEAEKRVAEATLFYNKQISDDRRKKNEEIVKQLQEIQDVFNQLAQLGAGIVNISVTNQKNSLQDLEDTRQKNYQQEIDRINNSTLSEQDKADRLKILEAKRQAQKEEYDRKNREIDQKKARFDKQIAIMNIILNTAVSIAKVLGNPFQVAIAAVLGAAQLAIAIATPIPKFAKGVINKKDSGLAVVGEQGPELVRIPGQKPMLVNRATTMFLPKGSDVINEVMYRSMARQTSASAASRTDKSEHLLMELVQETRRNNGRKVEFNARIKYDTTWESYRRKYYS